MSRLRHSCFPLGVLVFLVPLASCSKPETEFEQQKAVAEAFLAAAIAADTARLTALSLDPDPIQRVNWARTNDSSLLVAMSGSLTPIGGEWRGDTARVDFSFPFADSSRVLHVGFVRDQTHEWRVYFLSPEH